MDKQSIRKEFLKRRNSLSIDKIMEKSAKIKDNLFSSKEYISSRTACFYVSFGSEVHTHSMIQESIKNGKTVCVPIVKKDKLILSIISDFKDMNKKSSFGIMEPSEIREVKPNSIGLMIVPAIAFDRQGYRVGYGKGYYDNLLGKFSGKKIGLAFEMQIIDKIPIKEHDVKVDKVITESG